MAVAGRQGGAVRLGTTPVFLTIPQLQRQEVVLMGGKMAAAASLPGPQLQRQAVVVVGGGTASAASLPSPQLHGMMVVGGNTAAAGPTSPRLQRTQLQRHGVMV